MFSGGRGGQAMRQQVSRNGYPATPVRTIYTSGNYQTVRTQPAQQVVRTQYPATPRMRRSNSPEIEIIEEVRMTPVSSRVGRSPIGRSPVTPVARPAPARRGRGARQTVYRVIIQIKSNQAKPNQTRQNQIK